MAQATYTSQFGTKVWDARRVELPIDGQCAAQPHEPRYWLNPASPRTFAREQIHHRHDHEPAATVLSDVLSDAQEVLSDRRTCCPRLHMSDKSRALRPCSASALDDSTSPSWGIS